MSTKLDPNRKRKMSFGGVATHSAFVTRFTVFALCFAVFLWGTAYKLSLYRPQRKENAPAKLSTRSADIAKQAVGKVVEPPVPGEALLTSIELDWLLNAFTAETNAPKSVEWHISPPPPIDASPQLSLRPPPAIFRAMI